MSLSRSLSLLTGLVAVFGSVQAAVAHEFTAVLIAPAEPDRRAAMVAAFLLASAERDGHPDETSEGHLGGIDVQLEVLGAGEYDQLAVLAPEVLLTPLEDIDPARLPASAAVVTSAAVAAAPMPEFLLPPAASDTGFADRFQKATGTAPGPEATATYAAARLLDRALRDFDGFSNPEALRQSLAR